MLRDIRNKLGLSQSEVAAAAQVNVRVYQNYEQGARDINGAKLVTLLRLCQALQCSLSDIITDPEALRLLNGTEAVQTSPNGPRSTDGCPHCKCHMVEQCATFTADADGCIVVVKDVPTLVCQQCGEKAYADEVAEVLEGIVDQAKAMRSEVIVVTYPSK